MTKLKDGVQVPEIINFVNNEETDVSTAKCSGVAYSGKSVNYYGSNFIVDLNGLEIADQIPILYNHQNTPAYRLGVANISNDGKQLRFDGEIDTGSQLGKWLADVGKKWKWQVSIGFNVTAGSMRYVGENETAEINGETVTDCYIAGKSKLREISLCAVGADDKTSLEINMSLENYFSLNNQTKTNDGEKNMPNENTNPNPAENKVDQTEEMLKTFGSRLDNLEKKNDELEKKNIELSNQNLELQKQKAELEAKNKRPVPMMSFGGTEANASEVIENALGVAFGYAPQKDNKAAEVAEKKFKGGIGIKDAMLLAAKACGFSGDFIKSEDDFREAANAIKFGGMTNINLPIILGNLINRRIKDGFRYVEQTWREISEIIPVYDFKDVYTCRLSAGGEFEEIPAGGLIPVGGPITEQTYKNKAKTYGMAYTIDRQTIRNDDTNSISRNAFEFGRKGGLKLNDVFWTIFLNNADFFKAANNNLLTNAGALSIDSLSNLVALFDAQTDANGAPIGIDADRLLVAPSNEVMANHLYNDRDIRSNVSNKEYFTSNPHAGKYRPIKSRYLANSKYTGYSADDFYIFCDPNIMAAMQVCFLDGREEPYIEAFDAEFDTLGVRYRSYFDFGVALADPKAGAKADKA